MRGFLFWKRAMLALLSGQNEKHNHAKRDEVFVTPLVGLVSPNQGLFIKITMKQWHRSQ
jgi:hypothetical protein